MSEVLKLLAGLRRPSLMMRAARHGLTDYNRKSALRRLLNTDQPPRAERVLARLLDEEHRLEAARNSGEAAYSFADHVDLLIAILAEARLLRRTAEN